MSSSSANTDNTNNANNTPAVAVLASEVSDLRADIAKILAALPNASAPAATPKNQETVPTAAEEAFQIANLSYSLPSPSALAVSTVQSTRKAYAESGKLSLFNKPSQHPLFPARRFIPEP